MSNGFRYRVNGMGLLSAHPYLHDIRFGGDYLPHCLPAQSPQRGEVLDPIMLFESGGATFHQFSEETFPTAGLFAPGRRAYRILAF